MSQAPSGTVTFLFTDIESSTRRWEADVDGMRSDLAVHDELVRGAVERYAGVVFATGGDGFAIVFGRAGDALACAIEVQGALGEAGLPPVRMGVHTGEAEERGGDYFGPAVNRAARLKTIGYGGQVLVSQVTAGLVSDVLRDGVSLVDLGEQRLRDLSRPERVFQLVAPGLRANFPRLRSVEAFPGNLPLQLTSFVGRDEDVVQVAQALTGSRLVTLTGVGGVGKTRLAIQTSAELLPQFEDGVWLCELAATNDPDLVGQVLVAALGALPRPGLWNRPGFRDRSVYWVTTSSVGAA